MKTIRRMTHLILALTPALAAILLWNTAAVATPEMGEKEKKECMVCHVEEGSPDLNDAGKYYHKNKKLPPAKPKK